MKKYLAIFLAALSCAFFITLSAKVMLSLDHAQKDQQYDIILTGIDLQKNLASLEMPEPSPFPLFSTSVRAIYLTASTAKNPTRLSALIELVKRTNLNAMIINTKDDASQMDEDLKKAVQRLRAENIIPIARVVIFKDSGFVRAHPEAALKYAGGSLWRDATGATWLDPASRAGWDYLVKIARESADMGFEEINIDYVRFPTDGSLSSIRYPAWDGKKPKTEIIAGFFKYFNEELKRTHPRVKTSIDIFGYTFLTSGGLNIGQRVEDAALHFDYIAPMVYPSHYGSGNFGIENPATQPYLVIKKTLETGFAKLPADFPHYRIRPWLQAFNLGSDYNAHMLAEQIRALKEFGINEYYLWNPRNVYDRYESALRK